MKFADIFVPKWQHSNPEVRKKAVMGMKDTSLLFQISEKDADETVRDLASRRLGDLKDMRGVS